MKFDLIGLNASIIQRQAVEAIIKCNDITEEYGLYLSQPQAMELVATRAQALSANGRIEFGGGVVDKMILAFCDSSYISMHNYTDTLHRLIEMFYNYKNETLGMMGDDDLIEFMKQSFNDVCEGSLDLLENRELEQMAHNLRYGRKPNYQEPAPKPDPDEEDLDDQY